MLGIKIYGDMYVLMNLGLCILRPNLGQPSQINDPVKNVKASINDPNCERGHCSQSTMGIGPDGPLRIITGNALVVLSAHKDNHVDV